MSKRTYILSKLVEHVASVTGTEGFRGMKFLHQINSFPSFYIHATNESRVHKGSNIRYAVISLDLRVYCWEDNQDSVEAFVRSVEYAIQSFLPTYQGLIQEARVISVRTDEGSVMPHAVADLELEILYEVVTKTITLSDTSYMFADSTLINTDEGY